ncbi:MAG: hypothetical protein KGZ45_06630 [Clostridium sp.]|nr:hypothetical protein [Clostridium sp.]
MPSTFAWVDLTDKDRQKMMEIIRMGRERETRDELGIGTVRDSIANIFFPGTSTIQTRIKYMLLVPWIYLLHEKKRTPFPEIKAKERKSETDLIKVFLNSDDQNGVIGKEAGASLQRLPSSIYWAGLSRWGIRLFPGSQEQYHKYLNSYYSALRKQRVSDDEEPVSLVEPNWHPAIPEPPSNFPKEATLKLTEAEAEYLLDRISITCKDSLLAHLVTQANEEVECAFVWEHPQLADFPAHFRDQIKHAENFSQIMHGAFLMYNLLLAKGSNLELKYAEWIEEWLQGFRKRLRDFEAWDLNKFWAFVNTEDADIPGKTISFVEYWIALMLAKVDSNICEDETCKTLIINREKEVKRNRARLINSSAQDNWSGASGTGRLGFRWHIAKGMINDIHKSLAQ